MRSVRLAQVTANGTLTPLILGGNVSLMWPIAVFPGLASNTAAFAAQLDVRARRQIASDRDQGWIAFAESNRRR